VPNRLWETLLCGMKPVAKIVCMFESGVMTTLTIDIRKAEPEDARAISEAHRISWSQAYNGLIPHIPLMQMIDRRGEKWWRRAATGPATLLVADVQGVIAGYATIGLNRAAGLGQRGEIYELYMRPEYQGIGLGTALFKASKELLSSLGYKGLVAWCLEDSDLAVQFFHSHGGKDALEGMEDFGGSQLKKFGFLWN
jgi:GNAT superfamily N-acetyltransferase